MLNNKYVKLLKKSEIFKLNVGVIKLFLLLVLF